MIGFNTLYRSKMLMLRNLVMVQIFDEIGVNYGQAFLYFTLNKETHGIWKVIGLKLCVFYRGTFIP